MAIRHVGVEEAMQAPGLRMLVVGGVPSPWGEAAQGLFHGKRLDWLAVRLDYRSDAPTGSTTSTWRCERG